MDPGRCQTCTYVFLKKNNFTYSVLHYIFILNSENPTKFLLFYLQRLLLNLISLVWKYFIRRVYHELLLAMAQLQLTAIDTSDINPPEKFFSDGVASPAKLAMPLTLETAAFICKLTCAVPAMLSPHYHTLSCNVYMESHDYNSVLRAHVLVDGGGGVTSPCTVFSTLWWET